MSNLRDFGMNNVQVVGCLWTAEGGLNNWIQSMASFNLESAPKLLVALYENWEAMNQYCLQIGSRDVRYESYVSKRQVDSYSAQNAEHLFLYARDIAQAPIDGFEKHVMANPSVAKQYYRFKKDWDRKNGGGSGGLVASLGMRIGNALSFHRTQEIKTLERDNDPLTKTRLLVMNDPMRPKDMNEAQIAAVDYRYGIVRKLADGHASIQHQWQTDTGVKKSGVYTLQGQSLVFIHADGQPDIVWDIERPYKCYSTTRKSQMKIDEERRAEEERERKQAETARLELAAKLEAAPIKKPTLDRTAEIGERLAESREARKHSQDQSQRHGMRMR